MQKKAHLGVGDVPRRIIAKYHWCNDSQVGSWGSTGCDTGSEADEASYV